MNNIRGVISDTDFVHIIEKEMLDGLDQNVNVNRITIRKGTREIPTKHLILTFSASTLRETQPPQMLQLSKIQPWVRVAAAIKLA